MTIPREFESQYAQIMAGEEAELGEINGRIQIIKIEKETAIQEAFRFQTVVIKKDRELAQEEENAAEAAHRHQERRTDLIRHFQIIGRGHRITTGGNEDRPARVRLVAPARTSNIRCFISHPFQVEVHSVNQCYLFLALSNPERIELLFKKHRCYGCFLPTSVVGHELAQCPHSRFCSRCQSHEHHQLLCGPKKVYDDRQADSDVA
jgi:hypothetical protein